MRTGSFVAVCLVAALAGSGCAWLRGLYRAPRIPSCEGALVPSEALPSSVFLHLQVRVRSDRVDSGLQVVARRDGGALALVGLNPFGAKVFALAQEGTAFATEVDVAPILGVPPANLLRDVHRAHFLALPGAPHADGVHRGRVAGVTVEETWEGGALALRRIHETAGEARVRFGSARGYTIEHPACGYRATVQRID